MQIIQYNNWNVNNILIINYIDNIQHLKEK